MLPLQRLARRYVAALLRADPSARLTVEQVLQHLDADGNGEISYIEFETFVDERGSYDDRGSKK